MNLPVVILTIRWMVRDTFRQALASGIFWLMLGASLLCILFCLSAGVDGGSQLRHSGEPPEFLPKKHADLSKTTPAAQAGVEVIRGDLTLAFGALRLPLGRDAEDSVRFLQLLLAGVVADAAGVLLALIWTASFLPTFLDPNAAAVMFSKPVPRWALLLGKYLGVVAFVGLQATVFVGGTWAALGLSTGWWIPEYLWCIPALLLHFAVMYSASVLLATLTRSPVACVLGSVFFWFLCWGVDYGRHAMVAMQYLDANSSPFQGAARTMVEAAYWILPKPADFSILLQSLLHAGDHFAAIPAFDTVQHAGAFHPEMSILSSLAFAGVVFVVATRQLGHTDY